VPRAPIICANLVLQCRVDVVQFPVPDMTPSIARCPWAEGSPRYRDYHDREWGVPVHDDRTFFEFLILEGAQAGLSWSTILDKRDGYREAFADFDPAKVARFDRRRAARLVGNAAIVRNRLKIASAITNARGFIDVQREFGSFDAYVWPFVDGQPRVNRWRTLADVPAKTAQSDALSKDLAKRGFKFVGSTIVYAFMQATGLVNDHLVGCPRWQAVQGDSHRPA
jgi:DNA-3-methyladenine glycosylase I